MSKFHINKHGVPAPCRATKGNCPLGGDESHFDSIEEAQEHVNNENENRYGLLSGINSQEESSKDELESGNYIGNYHEISKHANENLRTFLTHENFNQVLNDGFKGGDIQFEYEAGYMNDSSVQFNATISKVSNDEYKVIGQLKEHSYVEKDFDTKEDYEEYLEGEPEVYDVNYKFTGNELKEKLIQSHHLAEGSGTHEAQTAGAILYGVYNMTRDKIDI